MPKPKQRSRPLVVMGTKALATVPASPPPDSPEAMQRIRQLALAFGINRHRALTEANPGISEKQ